MMDKRSIFHAGGRVTGCNLRAHLGGVLLQAFGLEARKGWFYGDDIDLSDTSKMTIRCPNFALEDGLCPHSNFHAVPIAKTSRGDLIALDPMFYDGPVPVSQMNLDFRKISNDEPANFSLTGLRTIGILDPNNAELENALEAIDYTVSSILELRGMLKKGIRRDSSARIGEQELAVGH